MADFNEIKSDSKTRMDKTIETLKADFGGLRAGRAHVSLLDGIMVEAYGSMTPLCHRLVRSAFLIRELYQSVSGIAVWLKPSIRLCANPIWG